MADTEHWEDDGGLIICSGSLKSPKISRKKSERMAPGRYVFYAERLAFCMASLIPKVKELAGKDCFECKGCKDTEGGAETPCMICESDKLLGSFLSEQSVFPDES